MEKTSGARARARRKREKEKRQREFEEERAPAPAERHRAAGKEGSRNERAFIVSAPGAPTEGS